MAEPIDITFGGVSNEPNDYKHNDGDLSVAINAVKHNGSIRPVAPGKLVDGVVLEPNYDLLYIHSSNDYTHYILRDITGTEDAIRRAYDFTASLLYNEEGVILRIDWNTTPINCRITLQVTESNTELVQTLVKDINKGETKYDITEFIPFAYRKVYPIVPTKGVITACTATSATLKAGPVEVHDTNDADYKEKTTKYFTLGAEIDKIESIGNTLVITNSDGMRYYLWKDGEYKDLGTKIPNVKLQFALSSNFVRIDSTLKAKATKELSSSVSDTVLGTMGGSFSTLYYDEFKSFICGSAIPNIDLSKKYRFYNRSNKGVKVKIYKTESTSRNDAITISIKPNSSGDYTGGGSGNAYKVSVSRRGHNLFPNRRSAFQFYVDIYSISDSNEYGVENTVDAFNAVSGAAKHFIRSRQNDENKFVMPFFVRSAIRLYDGTYTMQSQPALMVPNSGQVPLITSLYPGSSDENMNLYCSAYESDLQYKISQDDIDKLDDWSDIIDGVSVGVSSPIYVYDQSQEYDQTQDAFSYSRITNTEASLETNFTVGQARTNNGSHDYGVYSHYKGLDDLGLFDNNNTYFNIKLPHYNDKQIAEEYKNIEKFFVIKDFDVDELEAGTEFVDVELDASLADVTLYPVMDDDYNSHNIIKPSVMYTYNARLNVANIKEQLWGGLSMSWCNPYSTGNYLATGNTETNMYKCRTVVEINDSNTTYSVASDWDDTYMTNELVYYFYPNPNAKKVTVYRTYQTTDSDSGDVTDVYEKTILKLDQHSFIHGSFWFNSYGEVSWGQSTEEEADAKYDNVVMNYKNKVYTSEPANPFSFKSTNMNTIGTNEIIGLSSNTKALSLGQFGSHPMYCFSEDGIWALKPTDNGGWSSVQPISRDVCLNGESITQTDSAVLFVTSRGLMAISGSEVTLLTEVLNGHNFSDQIPKFKELLESDYLGMTEDMMPAEHIVDYLKKCRFLYDYKRQYIYCYMSQKRADTDGYVYDIQPLGYVFDLQSKCWGMYNNVLVHNVNNFTDAYAMTTEDVTIEAHKETQYKRTIKINIMNQHDDTALFYIASDKVVEELTFELSFENSEGTVTTKTKTVIPAQYDDGKTSRTILMSGRTGEWRSLYGDIKSATITNAKMVGELPTGVDILSYDVIVHADGDEPSGSELQSINEPVEVDVEETTAVRNKLVNMSEADDEEATTINSFIISRPITFGAPDLHKTLEEIRLRGIFDTTDMKLVLWASDDGKRWKVLGSSNKSYWRTYSGTPYKYFRIGVIANWQEQDSLNGATCVVTPRLNNRIR